MTLFIDTSNLNKVRFALLSEKTVSQTLKIPYEENYKTLEHLEKFLKKNDASFQRPARRNFSEGGKPESKTKNWILKQVQDDSLITQIIICSGPGSFTGLRVGASIAQGMKLAHGIKITPIKKTALPKNLKTLLKLKSSKKLEIDYGRPAIY